MCARYTVPPWDDPDPQIMQLWESLSSTALSVLMGAPVLGPIRLLWRNWYSAGNSWSICKGRGPKSNWRLRVGARGRRGDRTAVLSPALSLATGSKSTSRKQNKKGLNTRIRKTFQTGAKIGDSGLNTEIDSFITKVNNNPSHDARVDLS